MPLVPCASCQRHLRAEEPRCPFCSAPRLALTNHTAWLARAVALGGSAATLACAAPAPAPAADPPPHHQEPAPVASASASDSFARLAPPPPSGDPPRRQPVAIYGSPEIRILQQVHFEQQSARLGDASRPVIRTVAELLATRPDLEITVDGHADSSEKDADSLGQQRAEAVRAELLKHGVQPARFPVKSYGAQRPIAPSDTKENRALNRRVAFTITKGP